MRKETIAAIALCSCGAASSAPGFGHPAQIPRTVMAIVAHPDDELFIAPALASEARSGSRVIIVYATDGDAGPGVSGMDPGEELAQARRAEAYCAAEALGAVPVYLQFGDGTLSTTPRSPESAAVKLGERIGEEIAARRPQTVITWGPDGGYGHGDHRMVSALVTQSVQGMDASLRPDLQYSGIAKGRMPEGTPFGRWAETDPELLNRKYSYNDEDLAKSVAASQCHKTQFDETSRAGLIPFLHQTVWRGEVAFRSAF